VAVTEGFFSVTANSEARFDLFSEPIPQKPGLFRARAEPGDGFFPQLEERGKMQ
jgi:hypothetical protein